MLLAGVPPRAAITRIDGVHIVIMGCGRVGSSLARSLEKRGHTVAVIDMEVESFRRLGPDFAGKTVKGVGFDREVLEEAGIEQADGFAAVSTGDNSNILAARVVREKFESRTWSPGSTTPAGPRCTSGSASPRWPPCAGRRTRCCAGCCPPAPSRSGATRPARCG